jgi:hypothetical protein
LALGSEEGMNSLRSEIITPINTSDEDKDSSIKASPANFNNLKILDPEENKQVEIVVVKPEPKAEKPVSMSSVGKTHMFPRTDNIYKKKESLPYDESQTKVWRDRPRIRKHEHMIEWKAYLFLGVIVGCIAFFMAVIEEIISGTISHGFQEVIA